MLESKIAAPRDLMPRTGHNIDDYSHTSNSSEEFLLLWSQRVQHSSNISVKGLSISGIEWRAIRCTVKQIQCTRWEGDTGQPVRRVCRTLAVTGTFPRIISSKYHWLAWSRTWLRQEREPTRSGEPSWPVSPSYRVHRICLTLHRIARYSMPEMLRPFTLMLLSCLHTSWSYCTVLSGKRIEELKASLTALSDKRF